jgi:hypothetical protein
MLYSKKNRGSKVCSCKGRASDFLLSEEVQIMSIVVGRYFRDRIWVDFQIKVLIFAVFLAFSFLHMLGSSALSAQTREQCDKCCQAQSADEYYTEQCKLRCFRNPDHCMDQKSMRKPAPAPPPSAEAPPRQPAPSAEAPREQPKRPAFRLPDPLNLTPGRERDAAAQILAINGISPQHLQYAAGLQAIENVLVNFARANPSGGKLPKAQLENILRQLR